MTWPPRHPTPPHLRRYGWYRRYSGFVSHRKWRTVARMTGLHITRVIAVVDALQEAANDGRPRGSLAEFSTIECAAALDLEPAEIKCVYDALEELGWIENEYIVTWDERQPDREDPTAAERQRRRRAKLKAQRLSTCHAVTSVTSRPDQTRVTRAVDNESAVDWEENAAQWLSEQGLEQVCRCGKLLPSQARTRLGKWRSEMGDDEALRNLINASSALAADGRFLHLVAEGVARHRHEAAKGAALPFGPVQIRAADGGENG